MERKWYRPVLVGAVIMVGALVKAMPFWLTRRLASLAAALGFWGLRRYRRTTLANLCAAFGDSHQAARIAKRLYVNLGLNFVEWVKLVPRLTPENVSDWITADRWDRVDQVLAEGKGCIFVGAHFGNWELMAIWSSLKGYPSNILARRIRYPELDRLISALRRSTGVTVLNRDEVSLHQLAKVLKANQLLGFLADQDIDSVNGVFVEFFGRPAYTAVAPVQLALLTGAPIIPVFIVREGWRHRLIAEAPIEVIPSGDRERDLLTYTQRWSNVVESYIRRWPDHWVWMHPRWKTQP